MSAVWAEGTLHWVALMAAALGTRQKPANRSELLRKSHSGEKRKRLPYAHHQCFTHIFSKHSPVEKGTCSPEGWFWTAQHTLSCIKSNNIFQPYVLILQLFVFMWNIIFMGPSSKSNNPGRYSMFFIAISEKPQPLCSHKPSTASCKPLESLGSLESQQEWGGDTTRTPRDSLGADSMFPPPRLSICLSSLYHFSLASYHHFLCLSYDYTPVFMYLLSIYLNLSTCI